MTENHPARNAADVMPDVEALIKVLSREGGPFSKVMLAGSLRRGKTQVHDAEVVAEVAPSGISKTFKSAKPVISIAEPTARAIVALLSSAGVDRAPPMLGKDNRARERPWGPKYYCGLLPSGLQLDLFLVAPPATWPVIYLIRTGNADFSQAFVTRLHKFGLKSEDGRIVDRQTRPVAVESEEALFNLARMPFIPPAERDMGIERTRALMLG